jgi:RNA polymerase sigma-70 factor (ECF subfamily)
MRNNDQVLVEQAQSGNIAAFEKLIFQYDREVLSIAATYVNNADDAKDIYQDVLLRVYRALPKFEHRSEFSTWLFRITTNVCLTHRARAKHHAHASLDAPSDDEESHYDRIAGGDPTDKAVIDDEISSRIERALGELSPQQRLVFTLKHYKGYKLKEIADMTNCSEGTVKKHLFTAIRRLRERLYDMK